MDGLVGDAHRVLGYVPEQELGPRAAEALAVHRRQDGLKRTSRSSPMPGSMPTAR